MVQAGDGRALEKLVRHNLRFVVSVVKETPEWHHGNVPFEDLLAIGNEALLKAARKWVPRNGARFATYARPFIVRGVRRALDNEWSMIRVPVNIAEEIRRMKYTERVMTQQMGRDPTDAELADRLQVHVTRLADLRGFIAREPTSNVRLWSVTLPRQKPSRCKRKSRTSLSRSFTRQLSAFLA